MLLPAGDYSFWDGFSSYHSSYRVRIYFYIYDDAQGKWVLDYNGNNGYVLGTIDRKPVNFTLTDKQRISIDWYLASGTYNNKTCYPMLVSGTYDQNTMPAYEPYQADTYTLPSGIELGKWDKLNPETGAVSKQTSSIAITGTAGTISYYKDGNYNSVIISGLISDGVPSTSVEAVSSISDFTDVFTSGNNIYIKGALDILNITDTSTPDKEYSDEEIAVLLDTFKTWLAENSLVIAYKSNNIQTSTIQVPTSPIYKAYNGGMERVYQAPTNNGTYGALPTIVQEYYVTVGDIE